MPLPALLLNPWTLGILGSVLPSVISALAGSKTPEEARAAIEPQHNAMVTQLIGRGMRRSEAIAQADEALKGALADKAQEGSVPPWADAVMSVAGGIGGGALGAKLAKGAVKGATKAIGKAATAEAAGAAAAEKAANTATKGAQAAPSAGSSVVPDEVLPPFAAKPVQQPRLEYTPEVGSPPPAQPMSPHEDFRRFLATEERSQPLAPFGSGPRTRPALPYDPDADVALQMRLYGE